MRIWSSSIAVICTTWIAIHGPTSGEGSDKRQSSSFRLTSGSKIEIKMPDKPTSVTAEIELFYTWTRLGSERNLRFDSLFTKMANDDKESMNIFMSRSLVRYSEQGKRIEMTYDRVPDDVKKQLRDSFETTLCIVQFDEKGNETKRKIVAGDGAKDLVENGTITIASLFHPPFCPDRGEWHVDSQMTMGNGGFAKGKLTYSKKQSVDGEVRCIVSGSLTNDSFRSLDPPVTYKNARYQVKGEQTYAPAAGEWSAGNLSIDVSFLMSTTGIRDVPAAGTMSLRFEKLSKAR